MGRRRAGGRGGCALATTGGFIAELKRRNVIRMAGLYLVTAWLVVQVGATLLPIFDAPAWTMKALVVTLAAAFLPSLALAWVFELTPQGLKRDDEVPASESVAPQNARKLDRAIIAVLALALGYFAFDKFVLSPRRDAALVAQATQEGAAHAAKQEAAREKSIAVLPLVNGTGDPEQQFFSDGLSENLIDVLSTIEGLRVTARTSSFLFRDSREPPRSIGEKLGVNYLLSGSVQRSADTVRVRTEMVDTRNGRAIWSKQFDRPNRDLFVLQDELSRAIADVLKVDLLDNQGAVRGNRPPSESVEAYNAFTRGNFFGDLGSERDTRRAIAEFVHATDLDPRYAVAWASLSRNWTTLAALYLSGADAAAAYRKAGQAGDKALALAPGLGDSHVARGWMLENTMDWSGAMFEYERALELQPSNLQTKFSAASMLALQGRLTEAVKKTGEALERNPLVPNWWNWYSAYLSALGRLDDAEAAIRKSLALRPQGNSAWAQLAIIEIQRGDARKALEAATNEPEGPWHDIARAMALQIGTDRAMADTALQQLIKDYGEVAAYQIAQVYALRRDDKKVFEWLERARVTHDPGVGNTLIDPLVMHYKQDPRLAAFCAKVGLPVPTVSETTGI